MPDDRNPTPWTTPADFAHRRGEYRRRSPAENARDELLADWYGEDLAPGEIEAHQRRATGLGAHVDHLLARWEKPDRVVLRQLVERWSDIVGAAYCAHTQPRRLENHTLAIEVMNTVVLCKLQDPRARQVLLDKVRALAGAEVTAIRFVAGGESTSRPAGALSTPKPKEPTA